MPSLLANLIATIFLFMGWFISSILSLYVAASAVNRPVPPWNMYRDVALCNCFALDLRCLNHGVLKTWSPSLLPDILLWCSRLPRMVGWAIGMIYHQDYNSVTAITDIQLQGLSDRSCTVFIREVPGSRSRVLDLGCTSYSMRYAPISHLMLCPEPKV